uniref:Uncharacterized protein n=1 Tax=Anopheles culicifacies TaxID=139723 RepID=A0A182M538_9DIPT
MDAEHQKRIRNFDRPFFGPYRMDISKPMAALGAPDPAWSAAYPSGYVDVRARCIHIHTYRAKWSLRTERNVASSINQCRVTYILRDVRPDIATPFCCCIFFQARDLYPAARFPFCFLLVLFWWGNVGCPFLEH